MGEPAAVASLLPWMRGGRVGVVVGAGFLMASLVAAPPVDAANCGMTSTGYVPLSDLGSGSYLGQFAGGLYPDGSNAPPASHLAAGVAARDTIVPRNASGQPDPGSGVVVLLSIGMSATTAEFCRSGSGSSGCDPESFMGQAAVHPAVDHTTLRLVNGAIGGRGASLWTEPGADTYAGVATVLAEQGVTEAQVQVVWVKNAHPVPTVSLPNPGADAYALEADLAATARAIKIRYPNVAQVFFSSVPYAGYSNTTLNPEPYAYEAGFSVKWAVEAQIAQMATPGRPPDPIAGDLDYDTVAPWIGWGPYLWADGLAPRSDGLTWECGDFQSDGVHPASAGIEKVAGLLLDFFLASPFTESWFRALDAPTTTTIASTSTTASSTTLSSTTTSTTTTLPSCPVSPRPDCRTAVPRGATIRLRDKGSPKSSVLEWTWHGSPEVSPDFGTPTSGSGYALCLYVDGAPHLVALVSPGGRCGTRSCWKARRGGFRYADARGASLGVRKVVLAERPRGTTIAFRSKGRTLALPPLPLPLPILAQVVRTDAAACWGAGFSAAGRDDAGGLRARSD